MTESNVHSRSIRMNFFEQTQRRSPEPLFTRSRTWTAPGGNRSWIARDPGARSGVAAFFLLVALLGCASAAPGTIGAALGQRTDHRLFVRSVPPGEGADRAGLAVDDEILLIDGKEVRSMTQEEVRKAVRGDVGSAIVVTVLRGTEKREVRVVRTALLAEGKH